MVEASGQYRGPIKPQTFNEYVARVSSQTGCNLRLRVQEFGDEYIYRIDAIGPFEYMRNMCLGTKHVIRWSY